MRASIALGLVGALALAPLALLSPASADPATPANTPVAPSGTTGDAVRAAVDDLPGIVRSAMRRTGVPGVAVAVVHNNRLVYSEGFGVRDVRGSARVTPQTVFQMASVSKPVGMTAVARAIGRGEARWDDPIVKHLPDFALADPWVSEHVTVGDFYAHRSGIPGLSGDDLEALGFDRATILDRLRLEPLDPFRVTYHYSNFGLTTAGEAVAAAADTTWEDLARSMIFGPLGMRSSSYTYADFRAQANRAHLHQQTTAGRWIPGPVRNANAQAPAGGLSSTVLDMSRWMRMVLDLGRFNGERVVARAPLTEALSLQMRTTPTDQAADALRGYGFGMGVSVNDLGRIQWSHSGAFTNGAATTVLMVPDLRLGIVVLTNGWPVGLPEAVAASFTDLVEFGEVRSDYVAEFEAAFAPYTTPTFTLYGQERPRNPEPARELKAYRGQWSNEYVGTARITVRGDRLVLRLGPDGATRIPLSHWSGDQFFYNDPSMPAGFYAGVLFAGEGPAGQATSMNVQDINSGLGLMARS